MTTAAFHVSGLAHQAETIRDMLPFAVVEHGAVIIRSPLSATESVNAHLVWLWSFLQHKRRYLESLQTQGAQLSCICCVPRGKAHLLPNGAQMLHLLGVELIIEMG
jgi:hypothetical protein